MNDNDKLLSPSPIELICVLLGAIFDLLGWVYKFNLTNFLARLLGHGFDPEGSRLPEWKQLKANTEDAGDGFMILPNEYVKPEGEGVAIYDKVVYTNAKEISQEPWMLEVLTQAETISLFNYNPRLTNLSLAKQVKYYLKMGKTDNQIAVISNYKENTVKHYRLALEKAAKTT